MSASTKPKLRNKKSSLKNKLFPRRHSNKPKLKNLSSGSNRRSSNNKFNRRTSSKFTEFVHCTFQKLLHSPTTCDLHIDIDSDVDLKPKITRKTYWKPSLETIYGDKKLLDALIAFMKRSYNEECILFLQSIHELNSKIDTLLHLQPDQSSNATEIDIDHDIQSIFQLYVASSAEYQVNLSYNCFINTSKRCHLQSISSYTLQEKQRIFDESATEIEQLMIRSVLTLFYQSDEFQVLAEKQCPFMPSPISLSMSESTLSADSPAVVELDHEMDEFYKDEWIFTDEEYLSEFKLE